MQPFQTPDPRSLTNIIYSQDKLFEEKCTEGRSVNQRSFREVARSFYKIAPSPIRTNPQQLELLAVCDLAVGTLLPGSDLFLFSKAHAAMLNNNPRTAYAWSPRHDGWRNSYSSWYHTQGCVCWNALELNDPTIRAFCYPTCLLANFPLLPSDPLPEYSPLGQTLSMANVILHFLPDGNFYGEITDLSPEVMPCSDTATWVSTPGSTVTPWATGETSLLRSRQLFSGPISTSTRPASTLRTANITTMPT